MGAFFVPVMAGPDRRAESAGAFHDGGYAGVFLHEGDFNLRNYHAMTDLLENLEMEYEERVVEMAMAVILHFATAAGPPSGLTATKMGSAEILLEWNHSPDADVVGYRVEIIDGSGGLIDDVFTRESSLVIDAAMFAADARVRVRAEDLLGPGEASHPVLLADVGRLTARVRPNPTTGLCSFDVFVPGTGEPVGALLTVVDAAGRLVGVVYDGRLERGPSTVKWVAGLEDGERPPNGVYFFRLETDVAGTAGGGIILAR